MGGFLKILKEIGNVQVYNEFEFNADIFSFHKGGLTLSPREILAWPRMRYEDPQGEYGC